MRKVFPSSPNRFLAAAFAGKLALLLLAVLLCFCNSLSASVLPAYKTAPVIVHQELSSNAKLAHLVISSGGLTPAFAPATTTYTAIAPNKISSVTVTPTTIDPTATITVNGAKVLSGSASAGMPLNAGDNAITVVVTAQDGVTIKIYTITVTGTIGYAGPKTFLAGTAITPLGPTGAIVDSPGYSNSPIAVGAGFNKPRGLAVDAAGNVYVADYGNNKVKKIPVGGGDPVIIGSGFSSPTSVALDAAGNIYVADFGNGKVKKIPVGGGAPVVFGSGFVKPYGLAIDAAGNIYVSDQSNSTVKKFPSGGGAPVPLGFGFSSPSGMAVDAAGNVYVADFGNHAVKQIPIGGGPPVTVGAGLNGPIDVTIDASGNLFVADYSNHVVKKFPVRGGSGVTVGSEFNGPAGIALAGSENVYVADYLNNAVKKVKPDGGYYIRPALPAGLNIDVTTGIISGTPLLVRPAKTYTITGYSATGSNAATVSIEISANAGLANLTLSSGILSPVFATATTGYKATVTSDIDSLKITPTTSDAKATVKVKGKAITLGTPSAVIHLSLGSNVINTVVTGQDGTTTKTYTVTITRVASSNANLTSLKITGVALSPSFKEGTTAYTASVGNSKISILVTPITSDANATVKVNGDTVASGSSSGSIFLHTGPNTINTVVTAQNGTTKKTYTIVVTRDTGTIPRANINITNTLVASPASNHQIAGGETMVHQGISPNGDGANDIFVIDGITNYPDNRLTIMNRSGVLVYEARGYDNSARVFNGHSNKTGKLQLPGTYFYSLEYKVDGVTKRKTGFIVLKY